MSYRVRCQRKKERNGMPRVTRLRRMTEIIKANWPQARYTREAWGYGIAIFRGPL